jgi:hypothetical protein
MRLPRVVLLLALVAAPMTARAADLNPSGPPAGLPEAVAEAKKTLRDKHPAEGARVDRGVDQAARYWRASDGDATAFSAFARDEFLPSGEILDATFDRLEFAFERLGGYFTSLSRDLRMGQAVERGPMLPLDERLAGYEPSAHLSDDLFENKIAFVVLLNFPLTTLEERLREGPKWTRRQWAEARLAQGFQNRVPGAVGGKIAEAYARAESYIAQYNVYMHHVVTPKGERLFPPGLRLLSHWNLRDELKARYVEKDGLPRQRMIQKVMERIVRQEIPAAVVNNPLLDWEPEANTVRLSAVKDAEPPAGASADPRSDREPDTRYRRWYDVFDAERQADPYAPDNPTLIARRFNVNREIPEPQLRAMLEAVLRAPVGGRVAKRIQARLQRPLEPFDIWYSGFKPRAKYTEAELDAITRKAYPTVASFAQDIPRILVDLGFTPERARFIADHVEVDPARGSGHALGANRRDDKAHLRTRVGKDGMDYKGYNIAIHELGHNVEQVCSLNLVDHTLLQGVPNTAFTEALAFVFQARDLALLHLEEPDPAAEHSRALEDFWAAREIAGVALVDMAAWHWLYEHPEAKPAQFREAVVTIAEGVWNEYYAPLLGRRDVALLAIYSHMVSNGLYTPDYPIGHLIAFQLEEHFRKEKGLGPEFERVARQGALTPDAWMRGAVGEPLSAEPLLRAADRALTETDATKGRR